MEEYLTAKQVAEYLQVKPLTIYQWAREDKIPAIKIGRIWRFKKEAIDAFLDEQLRRKVNKK
jgi:PTS system nitrogen regulatory IIA component